MAELPTLAITVGDPAGIGPEVASKAVRDPRVQAVCIPRLYGPAKSEDVEPYPAGVVSAISGLRSYEEVVRAVEDALRGTVDGVVTGPINKASFAAAGFPWRGHTDLIAHLCGVPQAGMMFWSEKLRVVLATVHIPLSEVPTALTKEKLCGIIRMTAGAMPRFGYPSPRIAVTGLNPHAGEDGLLGREELVTIRPAIAECVTEGITVSGPFPADTVFVRAVRGDFDVVVACYHDQGLIPVKLLSFGHSVNVTIGVPIIRTSVDHGTAYDIARRGVADPGSMIEAILLAARLVTASRT